MEPRFETCLTAPQPPSPYHEKAEAWRIAKEQLERAIRDAKEAQERLDAARQNEATTWEALEEVSGRSKPKMQAFTGPGSTVGYGNGQR